MDSNQSSLIGKIALVTGAARRLGRAIVLSLARAGVDVVVHYHTHNEEAKAVVDEITDLGRRAWMIQADFGDATQAAGLMEQAIGRSGGIDFLINNASIFPADNVMDMSSEAFMQSVAIHAAAPLALSRRMARQGRSGHIVNLLDSRVEDYDRQHASYHLGKRMLLTLTRMLALELAPRIAVNALAPGLILPPEGHDESYLQKLAHSNPMQRYGNPNDITEAMLFLLRSEFITGQILYVDGGRHLKGKVYG